MRKLKKQNQAMCIDQTSVLARTVDTQKQVIVKTLSPEEKIDKIQELKKSIKTKKLAEVKKRVAEIKRESGGKGINLNDNEEEVFVPLTDEEKEMIHRWRARIKTATKSPIFFTYTLDANGNEEGSIETVDGYPVAPRDKFDLWCAVLNLATGAAHPQFGYHLFKWCYTASGFIKPDKQRGDNLNAVLSAMQALKPHDEIEGMLITRLISLHYQSMTCLACTNIEEVTPDQINNNVNRSSKLIRLYNESLEALMKYRRRGEQKFTVTHQHVQVNNGGRLLWVIYTMKEGGNKKIARLPHDSRVWRKG